LKAEEEERQRKRFRSISAVNIVTVRKACLSTCRLEEAKRNEELVKKLLEEERKEKERQNENRLYHCLVCGRCYCGT
jgi:hypothetical protein